MDGDTSLRDAGDGIGTGTGEKAFGSGYFLGALLGTGSMGRVYRATTRAGGDPVAIKVLRDDVGADADVVGRFLQERQVLVSISHRNVVRVHDLVVEGGQLGIVMDFVPGGDLRHAVTWPCGDLGRAASLSAQIADGLAAVHAVGVVHRDLKPENVLVDPASAERGDITLKLTDFGVARLIGKRRTQITSMVGTPGYIAPEIGLGARAEPATDVYALGVLLYELSCGQLPFDHENPYALLRLHAEAPVPRPDGMPDPLWNVLTSLLAKSPTDRPTAEIAAAQLRELAPTLTGRVSLAPPPRATIQVALRPEAAGPHLEPVASDLVDDITAPLTVMPGGDGPRLTPAGEQPQTLPTGGTPGGRFGRRRAVAIFAAAALVAAAIGTFAARIGDGGPSTVATRPITHAFAPTVQDDGIVVSRSWELSDDGPTVLRAELTLTNTGDDVSSGSHIEVIPKSVAADVDAIHFSPAPDEVLARDPVVRYDLRGLEPGDEMRVTYEVELSADGADEERLRALAADQVDAQDEWNREHPSHIAELATLSIDQPALTLPFGQLVALALTGTMDDGSPAPPEALAAVVWSTSDPAIVAVSGGTVTGLAPGTATVVAEAGDVRASSTVTVISNELAAAASTELPATTAAPAVTAPPATVGATSPPPPPAVTSPPETAAPPPTTARPTTTTTRPTTTTTRPTTTTTTAPPPPPPPTAPPRTVSISKGGSAVGQPGCSSSACRWVTVSYSNFGGGSHTVVCRASNGDEGGWYTYSTSNTTSTVCYYGWPGRQVWVTVDGVESSHITW
jgi:hypothetical protein